MAYEFTLPGKVVIGEGALASCETTIKSYGKRAFIVTGKMITKLGTLKLLTDYLHQWGIGYTVFNDITGEPTDEMIEAGVNLYKDNGCDFCIGIGGGSPLDSAKAIAAMSVLGGKVSDYMGKEISGTFPPMVLIPTTAGTGSETTKFTIITDTKKNIKMLLKGNALLPQLAVIDPSLTYSSPKHITAATGMDALTHAVEAYTSRKSNTLTDLYALSAVKRIFEYLPIAYNDGNHAKAREEMAIAAFEAGVCINNASVTLVHGMSRPIGALFHVPHGISNAMLIGECLGYVVDGAYERFGTLGRIIGVADDTMTDEIASGKFLEALAELCSRCEIPSLEGYGISKADFEIHIEKMANDAMASGSTSNTIKVVDVEDLKQIYYKLYK